MKTPYQRSYWVVPGRLLAGCYPGAPTAAEAETKLDALVDAGIGHVVNLMEEGETGYQEEPFVPYQAAFSARGVNCVRMPIADFSIPSVAEMQAILDDLDGAAAAGAPAYVHCWGGKGRTGTVVGCYLVRHGIARPDQAIERIAELQSSCRGTLSPSPESDQQRRFVRDWRPGQ